MAMGQITIVKLQKVQEVKLRTIARKGIGEDHAKWSPVATIIFMYKPEIHVRTKRCSQLNPVSCQHVIHSQITPCTSQGCLSPGDASPNHQDNH
ncbi:hypothetical protein PIB30_093307 [Stylosanthes scabra]|uniref:DNA-directed RNA polymerase insert domain-containing protein n=1 Tax=Stylosanthes scabra TaxID=79078 RepID=A0ABU6RW27_9FABA|nr:hypothetical protein [Stylosanthes scabra]